MNSSGYKPLKTLYHQAGTDARSKLANELQSRFGGSSTLQWNYHVNGHPVFVNVVTELSSVMEQIWRTEIEIQRLWRGLPGVARGHYLHSLLVSEIQSTNEIEGIYTTRKEVREAIHAAEKSKTQKSSSGRFQEMAKTYLLLFGELDSERVSFPKTLGDVRELYDRLLGQEILEEDCIDGTYFRKGSVSITDGTKEIHHGINGEDAIHSRILAMLQAQQTPEHQLINAFVGHFMLEHTHPFYDGNGRFGRFLLGLKLAETLSAPTAISLSAAVLQQKKSYYKAFQTAEDELNRGELTFFVLDMAKILLIAMEELLESLSEKTRQMLELRQRIGTLSGGEDSNEEVFEKNEIGVLYILGQVRLFGPRSGITMDELESNSKLSRSTLRPVTEKLRDRELIIELKRRPLIFSLSDAGMDLLGISD